MPSGGRVAEWRLDSLQAIGGHVVTVIGAPRLVSTPVGQALEFNGASDGIVVDANPIKGLRQFTIEVLFEPAVDGPPEQRFLHMQETGTENRALLETRMLEGGSWCLDTFLRYDTASRTLIDRARSHTAGAWHVASLVFDGRDMTHYVDGEREASGPVDFKPLGPGSTSIGVRMNRVSWFKGRIARVRVTPATLEAGALMKVPR